MFIMLLLDFIKLRNKIDEKYKQERKLKKRLLREFEEQVEQYKKLQEQQEKARQHTL